MRGIQEGPELVAPDVIGKIRMGAVALGLAVCVSSAVAAPSDVRHPSNFPRLQAPGQTSSVVVTIPNPTPPVADGISDGPDSVDPLGAWDTRSGRLVALNVGCNPRQMSVCSMTCHAQWQNPLSCAQSDDGWELFCECGYRAPWLTPICLACSGS